VARRPGVHKVRRGCDSGSVRERTEAAGASVPARVHRRRALRGRCRQPLLSRGGVCVLWRLLRRPLRARRGRALAWVPGVREPALRDVRSPHLRTPSPDNICPSRPPNTASPKPRAGSRGLPIARTIHTAASRTRQAPRRPRRPVSPAAPSGSRPAPSPSHHPPASARPAPTRAGPPQSLSRLAGARQVLAEHLSARAGRVRGGSDRLRAPIDRPAHRAWSPSRCCRRRSRPRSARERCDDCPRGTSKDERGCDDGVRGAFELEKFSRRADA